MGPLTTATTFSTIISLIAEFKSQRKDDAIDNINDFKDWLSEIRHSELITLIEQNQSTLISIKSLLNVGTAELAKKLEGIDLKLASIMSEDVDLSLIVQDIRPEARFSKQAISILQQFEDAGASKMLELRARGLLALMFSDGNHGSISYDEPRFIEDDLRSLIACGLLRMDHNKDGKPVYIYTRLASTFVNSLRKR